MKSKIINLSLIGTLLLGSASTFVSCKDTEADEISYLQSQVNGQTALYDALASQVKTLEGSLSDLKKTQDSLEVALNGHVADLKAADKKLGVTLDSLKDVVATKDYVDSELTKYLLKDALPGVNSLEDLANALSGENGTLVTKEEVQNIIANLPNNNISFDDIKDDVEDLISAKIAELNIPEACKCALESYVLKSEYEAKVDELEGNIEAATTLATQAKAAAATAQDSADYAIARANALSDSVATLFAKNELLVSELSTLSGNVETLKNYVYALDWSSDFQEALNKATAASVEASKAITIADSLHNVALQYADELVAKTIADTLQYYYTISDVNAKFDAANEEMKDSVANLRASINDLIEKYDLLSGRVDLLYKNFDQLVTSIIVEQTTNPVVGSVNLPGASSLILAGHYGAVTSADGVEFPTKVKGYFANANEANYFSGLTFPGTTFSAEGNEVLVQDAGSIYLTVNPNDVDYDGMTVELVNSRGEAAPGLSLSNLASSDDELTFGYSRSSNSGLYKTEATITNPAAVKKISIDASELKSAAKSVLSNLKGGSYLSAAKGVASVAADIFQGINNELPAYAVKTTYTTTDANGNEKTHSLTSGYKIAATAVPGLSYGFLQDKTLNLNLPQIPDLEALMNKVGITTSNTRLGITTEEYNSLFGNGEGILIEVPIDMVFDVEVDGSGVTPDVTVKVDSVYTTTEVSVDNTKITGTIVDGDKVEVVVDNEAIKATAKVDSIHITPNVSIPFDQIKILLTDHVEGSGKSEFRLSKTVTVTLTPDQIKSILSREAINQIIENKFGYLSEITEKLSSSSYNNYIKKFNSLISKFESLVSNPNKFLQPVLLYSNSSSLGQVSASQAAPSVITRNSEGKAEAVLYATSYSAELVVPAYKKYVAVYKYNSSSKTWEAYEAGNKAGYNTGKVISGDAIRVGFHAEDAGLYKIAYQALDYNGKVAGRCYYIRVK
jgi:hypothetical protein